MASQVALIDAGDGRRLERFASRIVDRPAPAATARRASPRAWSQADLRFEAGFGWSSPGSRVAATSGVDPTSGVDATEPWLVDVDGLTLELRPTASGGVGLYPEHAINLAWLGGCVARRGDGIEALNLFAHTGLATLALARSGARVAHVDAARSAVTWARRNAELSGLADRPIRWLVDDAVAFAEREARRGRRYDGIVLDPPTYGRSAGAGTGRRFTARDELERLLGACAAVAKPDAFVLVTAHTTGLQPDEIADLTATAFGDVLPSGGSQPTITALSLAAESGARLDLGWAIRLDPRDTAP